MSATPRATAANAQGLDGHPIEGGRRLWHDSDTRDAVPCPFFDRQALWLMHAVTCKSPRVRAVAVFAVRN